MAPFRYDPSAAPSAGSIASLMLRRGDIAAQATQARGAAWANAVQNIGQSVAAIPGQIQQQRAQAQQAEARGLEIENAKLQQGAMKRGAEVAANREAAMNLGARDKVLKALEADPDGYARAQQHFAAMDDVLKLAWGTAAAGVRDFGDTPEAALSALDDLAEQGFDDRKLDRYREMIRQDPQSVTEIVNALLRDSPNPKHQALLPKAPTFAPRNPEYDVINEQTGAVVSPGTPRSPTPPPNPTETSLAMLAARGDQDAIKALALLRSQRPPAQGPAPEKPSVWVTKDGETRFVTPTEAGALSAQGWKSGTSREQGRPVTSGDAGRIADFNTSINDLRVLRSTVFPDADLATDTDTDAATGTKAKIQASLPNWATQMLGGWGTEAKQRQAVIDRVKQVIGKALEGGVLRKEDEYKYEKILPTIGDVPDVVKSKLDGLEYAITQRFQTTLDALTDAGYDTSKFSERGTQSADGWTDLGGGVRVREKKD